MNVGEFTIRCYANLGSDLDRSNDTLVHAFNAVVGRDAYPMAVRTFNDSSTFDLSDTLQWADVTIENQGADSIRKVLVNISIFENFSIDIGFCICQFQFFIPDIPKNQCDLVVKSLTCLVLLALCECHL